MNPMPLLLALLVLAYLGSLYSSTQRKRSFGTASGVEFVLLGALMGPQALGVLSGEAVHAFDPVALMALGFIGLGYGLEWGASEGRATPFGRALLGCLFTGLVAACVGLIVFVTAALLGWPPGPEREITAVAAALVSAQTTRHGVRWVMERRGASGPLTRFFAEMAAADDAPVMIGLALIFARASGPVQIYEVRIEAWASALCTLGIGALLGGICAYLTYRDRSTVTGWSALLGCALMATGVTTSLGLSAMSATFTMGLLLSMASPRARDLRAKLVQTEASLLLPALLLAGARLELPRSGSETALIAVIIAARVGVSVGLGSSLALTRSSTRPAAAWIGLAMTSAGTLTMMVGLAFSLRLGGDIGRSVLSAAALGALVGELLGPRSLARGLERSGEIAKAAPEVRPSQDPIEVAP